MNLPSNDRLDAITQALREFVREREWEVFHDPKNLAMAIASEAGELLSEYRWISNTDSQEWSEQPPNRAKVMAEAADIAIALFMFADRLGCDLIEAVTDKIEVNRINYPAIHSRGKAERPQL